MDSGKVMLISGTSKGIGYKLALHYSQIGYSVIGCSRGSCDIRHCNYSHYELDISDEIQVKRLFSYIRKKYKRLDYLINNAAINSALSPVALVSYASAEETLRINFLGLFLMSRESLKIMMKNSFGRIINFGSMAVKHEERGEAIYTSSKAAVCSFTKILSKEVSSLGITCNVVSPSAIDTDLMKNINFDELKKVLSRNAFSELGSVEEVIEVIDWIISPNSGKITGQNIYLGGA
jgi:3-oxoacyl-[acyl-carrier protein] reductase